MTQKNSLHFDEYLESPEWKIRVEASKMLSYFLEIGKKPPLDREWKSGFKKRLRKLFEECEVASIEPIPAEIFELERHLSGKKHDVYPIEKSFVASCLAWNFDVENITTRRNEIISYANEVLNETGGLQKNMKNYKKPASGANERQHTIKRLLLDKNFLEDWSNKRRRYKKLQQRHDLDNLVEIVKGAIQK